MLRKRPFTPRLSANLLILFLFGCQATDKTNIVTLTATPTPTAYQINMRSQGFVELVADDQAAVPLPPDPSHADLGAEPYRQICLACHGDWGQGLTEEWRSEWGEDKNCWQSKCHASNHPPWGFDFPKTVPAVLGPGALSRFTTAASLREHIQNTMPWWNPGSLTSEQSWAITAYLMRERGEFGDEVTLNAVNAAVYRLHVPYTPNNSPSLEVFALIALLLVTMLGLIKR